MPKASTKKTLDHRTELVARSAGPTISEETLIGLGLNKMHRRRVVTDNPAIRGMINKIPHLVRIVEENGIPVDSKKR